MIIERSAGAIIFKQDGKERYYLILKNKFKNEYWDFPRGNIERGENAEQAALREVEEETGIKIQPISSFKESVSWFYVRNGKPVHKYVVFFLAKSLTSNVKLSFEHIGYDWLTYEKAKEMLSFKNSKLALEKANHFLNQNNLNNYFKK